MDVVTVGGGAAAMGWAAAAGESMGEKRVSNGFPTLAGLARAGCRPNACDDAGVALAASWL